MMMHGSTSGLLSCIINNNKTLISKVR